MAVGFCALRLAQRLLDPVPAGNCKLQTLRQYYRPPERGAHTALGDVQTVADLMAQVLRPIAGHRGLDTCEKLVAFAAEEWFPSRIAFGKHKGRLIQEARRDVELRGWLDWLAKSANARNAKMGRWYLRQLEMAAAQPDTTVFAAPGMDGETKRVPAAQVGYVALVIYINPELEQLRQLVAGARARLAELEVSFTKEKSRVDVMQAVLFRQLRSPCGISRSSDEHSRAFQRERNWTGHSEPLYSTGRALSAARSRRAGLIVDYRRKFLDSLDGTTDFTDDTDKAGEGTTSRINHRVNGGRIRHSAERFPSVASGKSVVKPLFSGSQADRRHQPGEGRGRHPDVAEIAEDPHGFILRQASGSETTARRGWATLDFSDEAKIDAPHPGPLPIRCGEGERRLHETLQLEIIAVLEALNRLRESLDYELCQLSEQKPGVLDELAAERKKLLETESAELQQQADKLAEEIKELAGGEAVRIS